MIENVTVEQCTCERCGEKWIPRTCPKCRNTSWNGKRGRKKIAPAPADEETVAAMEAPTVIPTRHSPPEKQTHKPAKAKELGKITTCRHGIYVLPDGTTMCKRCKELA